MFSHPLRDDAELRPLDLSQVEPLYELVVANYDRLRPWFPWCTPQMTVNDTRAFVEMSVARPARNDGFECCLFHRGQLSGMVGYHSLNHAHRRTALGYWLGAHAEGKGLMTLAVTALLDYGFSSLGLHRIEICADPDNHRSQAIPRRLGFTLECVRKDYVVLHGQTRDEVCYRMLAPDWKARKTPV
jgi:ribosomal-protein-serine acetyltransferase